MFLFPPIIAPVLQLGAQRNELFSEMQELLKQQQDEVAACRAALAKNQESNPGPGGVEQASQGERGAHFSLRAVSALSIVPCSLLTLLVLSRTKWKNFVEPCCFSGGCDRQTPVSGTMLQRNCSVA